ncbi:hypothetical protein J437_LFUL004897 [Ladona fulva]|uniref:Uncharacterized protein n=1 Tax=Ladona fulva TaxID=123851 RepID=A0A8K0JZC3_LADFU|nr:hypothetical protein J437_LFUL004897 [Ladona fulva]
MQYPGLLELSVARVQTVVCQNTCSRHGVCEQSTRRCLCEAFWMQDPVRKFLGDGVSNCDWSILYVVVGACAVVVVTVFSGWAIACLCQHVCGACCSSQGPSASDNALPQHRSKRHHRRSGRRSSSSPRKSSSSCSWPWCCAGGSGGEGAPSKGAHRRRSRYLPLGEEESGRGEDEDDNDEEDAMLHASPAHLVKCQPSLSEASNSDDVVFELNTHGSNRYNGTRRVKT